MFDNLLNIPGITWEDRRCRPPRSCGNECEHLTTLFYITFDLKLLLYTAFTKCVVVQGEAGSMGLLGKRGKRGERVSNNTLLEIIF